MKLRYVLPFLVLALAGCVNEGNKLERLRFTSASDVTTALSVPIKAYQCFPQTLTLIGEFTDLSLGEFTQRGAVYTSSNPDQVQVSNADIPLPDGTGFYARGVLIPVTTTVAPVTVTAQFAGYSTSVEVSVLAPGPVTVSPISPVSTAARPFVAPDSSLGLKAMTTFDGQPSNVTALGEWSFDAADDSVATIAEFTGVVTGKSAGTKTARFSLPTCPSVAPAILANATLPITIAPIERIEVVREFPGKPVLVSPESPLFTTDAISTQAVFAGGERQDLSFQSTLSLAPAGSTALQIRNGNLLTALQEQDTSVTPSVPLAPVTVTASFKSPNTDAGITYTATSEAISAKSATLRSVAIPVAQQNPVIAAFGTFPFKVIGSFDAGGTTLTQDITRHVGWTSSNNAIAVVGNVYGSVSAANGLATSITNQAGCVTITADTGLADLSGAAATISATTLLAVSPTTQPCTPVAAP